jgi:hypothetical protein
VSSPQAPAPELADLEALYDAHHRQAIGLAYRLLGDLGDAEEAVQEVFLSAWRSGHTHDPSRGRRTLDPVDGPQPRASTSCARANGDPFSRLPRVSIRPTPATYRPKPCRMSSGGGARCA